MDNKNVSMNKSLLSDISLWALLFSNLFMIFFYLKGSVSVINVIIVYWFQSVVIGFFTFIKILSYDSSKISVSTARGSPVIQNSVILKIFMAIFFIMHYGAFHLGYLFFILISGLMALLIPGGSAITGLSFSGFSLSIIIFSCLIFLITHSFSFFYNRKRDKEKEQNMSLIKIMFRPYLRIIPMDVFIVAGAFIGSSVFIFFIVLKIIVDLLMHILEHK